MAWHARLVGFLLVCLVLLGLNVAATISGVYSFERESGKIPDNLIYLAAPESAAG